MPVTVKKIGGKYRVVEINSKKIATAGEGGAARDGGGHATREAALAQARVINAGIRKRKK